MAELLAVGSESPAIPEHDAEASRAEAEAPEGWRVVWLPRHGVFLAFMDVGMPEGFERPAVSAPSADATLQAIRAHKQLAELIRAWIAQQEREEP